MKVPRKLDESLMKIERSSMKTREIDGNPWKLSKNP
jgi:hypothetical protein